MNKFLEMFINYVNASGDCQRHDNKLMEMVRDWTCFWKWPETADMLQRKVINCEHASGDHYTVNRLVEMVRDWGPSFQGMVRDYGTRFRKWP